MTDLVREILDTEAKIAIQEEGLLKHTNWNEIGAHAYNLSKLTDKWIALEEQLTEPEIFDLLVAKEIYSENTIWTDNVNGYKVDTRYTFEGIWETMVFKGSEAVDEMQYLTIDKAFSGHFAMIKKWG